MIYYYQIQSLWHWQETFGHSPLRFSLCILLFPLDNRKKICYTTIRDITSGAGGFYQSLTCSAVCDVFCFFAEAGSTVPKQIFPMLLTNGDVCVILPFARLRMLDCSEGWIPMEANISSVLFIRCSEFDRLHLVPLWAR